MSASDDVKITGWANSACSCGGAGPDDKRACGVCRLYHEVKRLRSDPLRVSRCNKCGSTVMPQDECPGCERDHHRETLRLAAEIAYDEPGECPHIHELRVMLEQREPWTDERKTDAGDETD